MRTFIITIVILIALILFVFGVMYKHSVQNTMQPQYDSLEVAIKAHNAILDTLANREAVIIQHQHNTTKRYYENHYTILAANDSATRENLLANIARFEHLHFDTSSQDH